MTDDHLRRVEIPVTNLIELRDFANQEHVDLTFVGNEEPLTLGIVDVFTDLSVWMGIRKTIEQVNANALAA